MVKVVFGFRPQKMRENRVILRFDRQVKMEVGKCPLQNSVYSFECDLIGHASMMSHCKWSLGKVSARGPIWEDAPPTFEKVDILPLPKHSYFENTSGRREAFLWLAPKAMYI